MAKFRILHCLRAPVGGLFRHVRDLSVAQAAAGHDVGVVVDLASHDGLTAQRLAALAPHLSLGLHRRAMSRDLGARDITATYDTIKIARGLDVSVIHGHGAKGGAYGRLAAARLKRRQPDLRVFYTPHGGSLHYAPTSIKGRVFMALERYLASATDGIIFESAYSKRVYQSHVGPVDCATRVIPNGVLASEFTAYAPQPGATDLLFIGELRHLKGVDLLLNAMAAMTDRPNLTATIVGDGPDAAEVRHLATQLGLDRRVMFTGALSAAQAFPMGRILVMPSRAESFPYIVLEAAAATLPLIATAVGGIPEITAGTDTTLVPPDDGAALALAITRALADPGSACARAAQLQQKVRNSFTVEGMSRDVLAFYSEIAR
jgi:glycosyltransferase involved in cell wall biosynthesis